MDTLPTFSEASIDELLDVQQPVEVMQVDGKSVCPKCGRSFKLKADGTLRAHKCVEGIMSVDNVRTVAAKRPRGRKGAPASVRRVGVALLGAGTETLAAVTVSIAVPMARADIPEAVVTLPDADAMIGPIIDRLFPELPKSTQALLQRLSEQEDLIAALFLWAQWTKVVGQYTKEAHALVVEERKTKKSAANSGGNVVPILGPIEGQYAGAQPFYPVSDGN